MRPPLPYRRPPGQQAGRIPEACPKRCPRVAQTGTHDMKRTRPSRPRVILNRSAVSELLNLSQTQLACLPGCPQATFPY